MLITATSIPGDPASANEDWFGVTSDAVVVTDGATSRTDTGCVHGAAWYARQLGSSLLTRITRKPDALARFALVDAICDVTRQHDGCDLNHPGTPSAAVGMVQRVGSDTVRYLVLGDVTVLIETVDEITVISDQRISASAAAERATADQYPIGSPEKAAALIAMKQAELAARNQPGQYWIAATDPSAAGHALVGDVAGVRRFAVLSDGAARFQDLFGLLEDDWKAALDVIGHNEPGWPITQLLRPVEQADPHGRIYKRNKVSDDATIVYAEVNAPPSDFEPATADDRRRWLLELTSKLADPGLYGERGRTSPTAANSS